MSRRPPWLDADDDYIKCWLIVGAVMAVALAAMVIAAVLA